MARVIALPAKTNVTAATTRARRFASSFGQSIGRKRHNIRKPPLGRSIAGATWFIAESGRGRGRQPQRMRRSDWNKACFPAVIRSVADGELIMGPGFYVIAILGCADGSAGCTPVATMPTRYESRDACQSATVATLSANSDFDFPTLMAQCRPAKAPAADRSPHRIPDG